MPDDDGLEAMTTQVGELVLASTGVGTAWGALALFVLWVAAGVAFVTGGWLH